MLDFAIDCHAPNGVPELLFLTIKADCECSELDPYSTESISKGNAHVLAVLKNRIIRAVTTNFWSHILQLSRCTFLTILLYILNYFLAENLYGLIRAEGRGCRVDR